MNPPRFLSKKDFAAHRGVGKSAVSNWVKKGWVVEAEDPADGVIKVDVPRTEAKLNAYLDPARGRPKAADSQAQGELPMAAPPRGEPAGGSLADVRTDLIRQQTEKLQLDNAKRAGDLVPIEEFTRRAAEYARVSRERMVAIVRTQAEWLASAKDPRAIVARLQDEIERGFADLADQIAAGELAEDAEDTAEDDAAVAAEVTAALVEEDADQQEAG